MRSSCVGFFLSVGCSIVLPFFPAQAQAQSGQEKSIQLFMEATRVIRHPRCMNCHPAGDQPTQGNDLHPHAQYVQRGVDDHGAIGMRCNTCHGAANYDYAKVPGAPKWGLAPRSMGWQGLSDGQLCEAIKDPVKNHGMSLEKLIEHMAKDPLVGWAWAPGLGREPAPGTQEKFGQTIAAWVQTGAHCP